MAKPYWNMNKVAHAVSKGEGKCEEMSIAQIKELLGVFADLCAADPDVLVVFEAYARKRFGGGKRKG